MKLRINPWGVWPWLALAGFLGFWGLEFFFENMLRNWSQGAGGFLQMLYPAFSRKWIELGPEAVLQLVKQLKFRWVLVFAFGGMLYWFPQKTGFSTLTDEAIRWRIRLFLVLVMLYLPDLLGELSVRAHWSPFYEPLPLLRFWLPHFPSYGFIQTLAIAFFGLGAWLVLGKWQPSDHGPAIVVSAAFLLWVLFLAWFFGFGKIDHTYASMSMAFLFLVPGLWIWKYHPEEGPLIFKVFQAGIWACYFFSGLEKLLLAGTDWFSSSHFQAMLTLHPNGHGAWLASFPFLSSFLLAAGLLFQLSSLLLWRFPNWAWVFIPAGVLFHLGTWYLFGVGGWQSPWIPMLFFLWPADSLSFRR